MSATLTQPNPTSETWMPDSWRSFPFKQIPTYPDAAALKTLRTG